LQNTPSNDELDASYKALRNVVEHSEFQRVLAEIQSLLPIERLQAAFTQLTTQALAAKGIPIPAGLTITTHASQDSASPSISTADVAATEQNTSRRPGPQVGTRVCLPIPFADSICWQVWFK